MRDLPDDDGGERVRLYAVNSLALYFLTHAATKDGSATVRYGKERVYACMTCVGSHETAEQQSRRCAHTTMTREFWEWLTVPERAEAIAIAERNTGFTGAVAPDVPALAAVAAEPIEWTI